MDKERLIKVCNQIASDMENDANGLDSQPFTGKSVGTQFGNNCAAIRALAIAVKELATVLPTPHKEREK